MIDKKSKPKRIDKKSKPKRITKSKKSTSNKPQLYCKRCGIKIKGNLRIQLTPSRIIEVCTGCFNWSLNKTMAEIRKDYKERARKRKDVQ